MLKRVLAGLIVAIMMSSAAVAGPLEDGNDALVRGDYALAVKWYHLAANQGHAEAQVRLGALYALGEGVVPQDYVLAHMWSNLAAAQGDADAIRVRDFAASEMTRDQLAEAQRLAREWKPSP
jgi:TPR repeat protein